ncbi:MULTISPECIES: type II toxin-antitoxin system YafO family toxin [Pseudomonas putida group]|uniref:type II toxin-antitoxin system YafO family toxin n=1 Tax=Pseudomonas monteilii TaxID=76759 RepID=UPI001F2F9D04|nr:type II toxin-antitoxin system YafO family toxin [Pseudomonas monteilii]
MSSVKVSDLFKKSENWYNFYAHFYNYKLCGDLPDIFGRDAELDLDDMHHIHLAANEAVQARWRAARIQHRRTTDRDHPEEDYWLIYAFEPLRDEYLLVTIIGPDAHLRQEWGSYLRDLSEQIVEPWVLGRIVYTDPDEEDEEVLEAEDN